MNTPARAIIVTSRIGCDLALVDGVRYKLFKNGIAPTRRLSTPC
jgi:hypothetical protein